jgi:hypothetical protein
MTEPLTGEEEINPVVEDDHSELGAVQWGMVASFLVAIFVTLTILYCPLILLEPFYRSILGFAVMFVPRFVVYPLFYTQVVGIQKKLCFIVFYVFLLSCFIKKF